MEASRPGDSRNALSERPAETLACDLSPLPLWRQGETNATPTRGCSMPFNYAVSNSWTHHRYYHQNTSSHSLRQKGKGIPTEKMVRRFRGGIWSEFHKAVLLQESGSAGTCPGFRGSWLLCSFRRVLYFPYSSLRTSVYFFKQWAPVERSQVCIPGTHTIYTDWACLGPQLQAEKFPKLRWGDRLECKKTMPCAPAMPATKPIIITNKTQTTHALLFQTALPLRIFMKRNANTCALKWVGVKEHSAQLYLGCYRFITCRHIFGAY